MLCTKSTKMHRANYCILQKITRSAFLGEKLNFNNCFLLKVMYTSRQSRSNPAVERKPAVERAN